MLAEAKRKRQGSTKPPSKRMKKTLFSKTPLDVGSGEGPAPHTVADASINIEVPIHRVSIYDTMPAPDTVADASLNNEVPAHCVSVDGSVDDSVPAPQLAHVYASSACSCTFPKCNDPSRMLASAEEDNLVVPESVQNDPQALILDMNGLLIHKIDLSEDMFFLTWNLQYDQGPVQRKLNKRQRAKKKLNVQILKELKAFECSFVQRKEDTHTSLEAIKLFLLNSPREIQEHIIDRIADTGTVWRTGLTLHICGIRFQRGSTLNDKKAIQLACHLGLVNTVRLIPYLIEVYDDKPSWGVARTISRLSRWAHCLIRSVVPRTIPIVLEEEDKDIVKAQRVSTDWYDMYEKKYNLLQPKPLCDEDG
ncbi:hypothetical protein L7F22_033206 [Adiantum nelumboides]|nr:hypothetical protein [Adiantum nelumboides]